MTDLPNGFYWAKLNDTSASEPAKHEDGRWTLLGDGYDTYPTKDMHEIGGPIVPDEWAFLRPVVQDHVRIVDASNMLEGLAAAEEGFRASFQRIKEALDLVEEHPVPRAPLTDARQLMYLQKMLVNAVIPLAESEPVDGNFTITLKLKRKAGKALVDAQIKLGAR